MKIRSVSKLHSASHIYYKRVRITSIWKVENAFIFIHNPAIFNECFLKAIYIYQQLQYML